MKLFKVVFTSKENGSSTTVIVIESDKEAAEKTAINVLKTMKLTYNPELATLNCFEVPLDNGPEIISIIIA